MLLLVLDDGMPGLLAEAKPWQEETRPKKAEAGPADTSGYLHPCLTDLGASSSICKAAEATEHIWRPAAKLFYFVSKGWSHEMNIIS